MFRWLTFFYRAFFDRPAIPLPVSHVIRCVAISELGSKNAGIAENSPSGAQLSRKIGLDAP
jgi:hypothetical protein